MANQTAISGSIPISYLKGCLATVLSWHTGTQPIEMARGCIILLLIYVWEENQITHCALLWCLALLERQRWREMNTRENVWEMKYERGNYREGKRKQTQADESRRDRQREARQTFPAARGSVRLHEMALIQQMFVLVPLYVEPGVKSVLLSSLFLTLSSSLSTLLVS